MGEPKNDKIYPLLSALLSAGYAVEFRPVPETDAALLTVTEAKNGEVDAYEIKLDGMEWVLAEEGIANALARLKEGVPDLWEPGDEVTYVGDLFQKGIVKRRCADGDFFVVYHCGEDWLNYQNYTAAKTSREDLVWGWVNEA